MDLVDIFPSELLWIFGIPLLVAVILVLVAGRREPDTAQTRTQARYLAAICLISLFVALFAGRYFGRWAVAAVTRFFGPASGSVAWSHSASLMQRKSTCRATSMGGGARRPCSRAVAVLSIWQYRSNPTAAMCPLCSVPRRFPAPRISRSRMAILKPLPSAVYCLMAFTRFRASPTVMRSRGNIK